jgi:carboxynorspermidine decarboxylase
MPDMDFLTDRNITDIDFSALPTPCYVVDADQLEKNLAILADIQEQTGCKILLALKGFAMFAVFPLIGRYLAGVTASSLFEARLGREEMNREVHIYAPAYREDEFAKIARLCDHIIFNSFEQWRHFRPAVEKARAAKSRRGGGRLSCGLRVNPGYSEIATPLYDPCAPFSRLGISRSRFLMDELDGIDGLHFHALCEQGADTLTRVAQVFDNLFGKALAGMRWLNLGGGHHITRPGYDIAELCRTIRYFQAKYGVAVYLEPGEAIALNAGFLVARVLDVVDNGMPVAILDTSATCHMPDVLEMPYRPEVLGAGKPGEKIWTGRLAGPSCLAGDVIGDYSFDRPLEAGDRVVFTDMAHYTMVKNNTFNGIPLPAIALRDSQNGLRVIHTFGYRDFKSRLS